MTQHLREETVRMFAPEPELDIRRRLASIESHQLHVEKLIMGFQVDLQAHMKTIEKRDAANEERLLKIDEKLLRLIGLLTTNGHDNG